MEKCTSACPDLDDCPWHPKPEPPAVARCGEDCQIKPESGGAGYVDARKLTKLPVKRT